MKAGAHRLEFSLIRASRRDSFSQSATVLSGVEGSIDFRLHERAADAEKTMNKGSSGNRVGKFMIEIL